MVSTALQPPPIRQGRVCACLDSFNFALSVVVSKCAGFTWKCDESKALARALPPGIASDTLRLTVSTDIRPSQPSPSPTCTRPLPELWSLDPSRVSGLLSSLEL
jgi:hypothetical protein